MTSRESSKRSIIKISELRKLQNLGGKIHLKKTLYLSKLSAVFKSLTGVTNRIRDPRVREQFN